MRSRTFNRIILLVMLSLPLIAYSIINASFDYRMCASRNSLQLGRALMECFGSEYVTGILENNKKLSINLQLDSMGIVKRINYMRTANLISETRQTSPGKYSMVTNVGADSIQIFEEYLKRNRIPFSIAYDPYLSVVPRTKEYAYSVVKKAFDNKGYVDIAITFSNWIYCGDFRKYCATPALTNIFLAEILMPIDGLLMEELKNKSGENHEFSNESQNAIRLYQSLLYVYGQYEVERMLQQHTVFSYIITIDINGQVEKIESDAENYHLCSPELLFRLEEFLKFNNVIFKYCNNQDRTSKIRITLDDIRKASRTVS